MADFSQKNLKKSKRIFHIFIIYYNTDGCKNEKISFFSARGNGTHPANGQYRIRKYRRCCRDDVHIVPTAIQNGKILPNPRGFPWRRSKGCEKQQGRAGEASGPVVINQKSNHSQTVRIGRNVPDMLWIKIVGSHVIYNGIMFQLPTIRLDR